MCSAATTSARRGWRSTTRHLWLLALVATLGAPAAAQATAGPVVSWGGNSHGELGTIYRDDFEASPVTVEGQNNIVTVAAGDGANLAILSDGTVSAWGGNVAGQLGDGTREATWEKGMSHVIVKELSGVTAVTTAGEHSLALLGDGTVKAWGNNQFGQLGNGTGGFESETHEYQNLPKTVSGLSEGIALASGTGTNFAVLANHTVKAWGWNRWGQLGFVFPEVCRLGVGTGVCPEYECRGELGWQLCSKVPRSVLATNREGRLAPLGEVTAVAGGGEAAYALLKNGHVMAWGDNGRGELGTGEKTKVYGELNVPPSEVINARTRSPLTGVVAIAAGNNHALALLETGEVVGWGDNGKGELGAWSESICGITPCDKSATVIPGLALAGKATAIAAGVQYSVVLIGGRVYAFGKDEHGELGDGSTSSSGTPKAIKGLERVTAISAGSKHAVALLPSGTQTPPPALMLEAGGGSLTLGWSVTGAERIICNGFEGYEPLLGLRALIAETIPLTQAIVESRSVTVRELNGAPLEARPYVLKLTANTRRRVVVATPLP
jgi:alpha-tubulin suppressor-like RCC1 family protein